MGGSAKEATKALPQSAQISGEVRTNMRRGNPPAIRSIRGASDRSNPVPAKTSYLTVGVSTRMVCTLRSILRDLHNVFSAPQLNSGAAKLVLCVLELILERRVWWLLWPTAATIR